MWKGLSQAEKARFNIGSNPALAPASAPSSGYDRSLAPTPAPAVPAARSAAPTQLQLQLAQSLEQIPVDEVVALAADLLPL